MVAAEGALTTPALESDPLVETEQNSILGNNLWTLTKEILISRSLNFNLQR